MIYPAVAVFAFNRPSHLKSTLDAFVKCPGSTQLPIYFFCDGPRNQDDVSQVEMVREIVRTEARFSNKTVIEHPHNQGLANSIIQGVNTVLENFTEIIVLEDDIEVSPEFLSFLLGGLDRYKQDKRVASICGYMYPIESVGLPESFFLKGSDCWGWATWKRAWEYFEPNGNLLLQNLKERKLAWDFDLKGSYPYSKMLKNQIRGKNNSWAIRWHASTYLRDMVSLFPSVSLVNNIGLDGSGTHCLKEQLTQLPRAQLLKKTPALPKDVIVNTEAEFRIGKYQRSNLTLLKKAYRIFRGAPRLLVPARG